MSECVVRMEMPKSCEECPLVQTYENDWGDVMSRTCNLIYKGYLSDVPKGERRPDCPILCQLPEGHGRLIDASTIIGEVDAGYTDGYGNPIPVNRPISVDEYLGLEVPTIVPAERSET